MEPEVLSGEKTMASQPQHHEIRSANHDQGHEGVQKVDSTGFVTDLDHLPKNYYYSKFFIGTYAAAAVALLAGVSAFAYAAPLLGEINADIGPDPNYIWISYVYNTATAVTFPIVGRLSDIFGRRYYFIGGAVLATMGSIVCARAQSIPTLIGGNVFLGVATSTQLSYHFVMGELVPMRYRYFATGSLYLITYTGSGFGPIIALKLTEVNPSVGWRSVYYLLLGYNVLALILWTLFYYPPSFKIKHGTDKKMHWIKNFDYVGSFLLTSGFVVFLFGISVGGTQFAWKSAPTILMIILGFLTMCAFLAWERFANLKEPLAPLHIFTVPWLSVAVTLGLAASCYYPAAIIWPQQTAVLYANGDRTKAALLACLPGLGSISGEVIGGPIVGRLPKHKVQTIVAFFIGALLTACCAVITVNNMAVIASFVFLSNFFMGWVEIISLLNSTIVIDDQQEIGAAGGLAAAIRTGISAIATVVYGTVLTNGLTTKVPATVSAAVLNDGLPASSVASFLQALQAGTPDAFSQVPGVTDAIIATGVQAYKVASVNSYRPVYLVSIAFGVIGLFCSFFTPNVDKTLNDKIAAVLHSEGGEKVTSASGEIMSEEKTPAYEV
ncbi:hypothetical protein Z517_09596 [Fonsecaea pedrosoi CBS 271.37]|uniref:Major facilitator superfamily (MFS) profile domain-containing protein n=1 Tax=Fonsecaea pedrosoi CBS 271.37 TaxID=1442368 RepID=A0A0D2GEV1_9EURO|nr:uncharacterized protein Z517_09596 [Fonsecaea pedrosoi CBS 271.37]KIW77150.1 hypothetical protein Z517_09596 [Fonsecaea pedrosoi CBS 271.37]